jgi:HD-GYP domain-containing protein (c-di-GMP phosphodiesterase class II)
MVRISSGRISEGMVLGRPIIDAKNRFLLTAGQVLNERYVLRIKELQIPFVYIDDQLGIEDPIPPVSPATISMATDSLKQCYKQFAETEKTDLRTVQSQISNIIDDLATNSYVMIGMSELKSYDDYTYQHSVNVCALSIILGISQGYSRMRLQNLGIGAMLHDIGKIKIPLEIINKPSSLTYEEYMEVKKHPWEGFKIINSSAMMLPRTSIYGVLQHHERVDGRGYPRGLSEVNIHEYGLIIAVADVFDALVSDRPNRPAFSNHEAMQIIERKKGTHLSTIFVDALLSHINMYPPGTVVILSNGDLAVVTQENIKEPKRPQTKLLFDGDNQLYERDRSFNLGDHKDVFITKVLSHLEAEDKIIQFLTIHKNN